MTIYMLLEINSWIRILNAATIICDRYDQLFSEGNADDSEYTTKYIKSFVFVWDSFSFIMRICIYLLLIKFLHIFVLA